MRNYSPMVPPGGGRFPFGTLAVVATAILAGAVHAQERANPRLSPSEPSPSPYGEVQGWSQVSPDVKLAPGFAGVIGILPVSQGNLWLLQRSRPAVLKLDRNGKLLKSFDYPPMVHAHGLCMDHDGNLWAGDQGLAGIHTPAQAEEAKGRGFVFVKFNQDGKVLHVLGKSGVSRVSNETFVSPSACVIAPNGDIIIADGHLPRPWNTDVGDRLMRFSKDGKFIRAYGTTGKAPGKFRGPHALAYDSQGRLFVADRNNNRIQIFDKDMKFVTEWKQFGRPSGMAILEDDTLLVTDTDSGHVNRWLDWPGEDINAPRNPAFSEGIRIGSARTGTVSLYIRPGANSEVIHGEDAGNTLYVGDVKYMRKR